VALRRVGGVANGTLAAARDIIQTVGQKLYMPDRTAKFAAEKIAEYARNHPSDRLHSVHLHSQGGAEGTSLSMYLDGSLKAQMGYFSYGSASNPVFGWDYQVHEMNILDPVAHVSGRGLLLLPVALFDACRPNVDQNWHFRGQQGRGVIIPWWYHSWFPSYEDKPARKP